MQPDGQGIRGNRIAVVFPHFRVFWVKASYYAVGLMGPKSARFPIYSTFDGVPGCFPFAVNRID